MDINLTVRLATIEDFPAVCSMAREFHSCTEYRHIEFDEASCFLLFKSALDQGMCFLSEGDEITGFIIGMVFGCPLNQMVKMASELAWWVRPAYRKTSAGVKLLKALESSAKENGAVSLTMICLESINPEEVQGIYERMGYSQAERAFLRVL